MILTRVNIASTEPFDLAAAKRHLRMDGIDTDDDDITALITVAREMVEELTGQDVLARTWDVGLCEFPIGDIRLPRTPVASVESVKYTDQDGNEQTVASEIYTLDKTDPSESMHAQGPRLYLNYNCSWPVARYHDGSVVIRCDTGYSTLPKPIEAAMKLLIAELYDKRSESISTGAVPQSTVIGVERLLGPYKRLYR